MHAVSAGRARDVRTVVYQQPCFAAASNLSRARRKLVKLARRQRLLAYLKQRDVCFDSSLKQLKYVEGIRFTARYRIDDRTWKPLWNIARHLLRILCQGSSGFAKQ